VTVATVSCGAGTSPPPTGNPPTGTRPAPTHKPGAPGTSRPVPGDRHYQGDNSGDRTAPKPQPKSGHVAVTG
jgi:hypothetical protein